MWERKLYWRQMPFHTSICPATTITFLSFLISFFSCFIVTQSLRHFLWFAINWLRCSYRYFAVSCGLTSRYWASRRRFWLVCDRLPLQSIVSHARTNSAIDRILMGIEYIHDATVVIADWSIEMVKRGLHKQASHSYGQARPPTRGSKPSRHVLHHVSSFFFSHNNADVSLNVRLSTRTIRATQQRLLYLYIIVSWYTDVKN